MAKPTKSATASPSAGAEDPRINPSATAPTPRNEFHPPPLARNCIPTPAREFLPYDVRALSVLMFVPPNQPQNSRCEKCGYHITRGAQHGDSVDGWRNGMD